jgi:hypothetical protein
MLYSPQANVFKQFKVIFISSSTQPSYLLIPVFVIICAAYPPIKSNLNAKLNINPKIKSKFPYVSFGWITKFSIQSPTLVSARTYKIDIKIVVKRADSNKIEIIAILFICSLSFVSSNLSLTGYISVLFPESFKIVSNFFISKLEMF